MIKTFWKKFLKFTLKWHFPLFWALDPPKVAFESQSCWHKGIQVIVKKLNISVIILFTLFQSNISQHQCIEFNFVEFVDALALTRILGSGSLSVTQAISKGVFS